MESTLPVFWFSDNLIVNPSLPGRLITKVGLVELYEYVIGSTCPNAIAFLLKYSSTCFLISLLSWSIADSVVVVAAALNLYESNSYLFKIVVNWALMSWPVVKNLWSKSLIILAKNSSLVL